MVANTGQTAPDDEWLSLVVEEIIEPDLAIIDPHHHLWLRNGYTYLMPELASDLASGHNIVATVYAECHSMYRAEGPVEFRSIGETEFARGQAAMSASMPIMTVPSSNHAATPRIPESPNMRPTVRIERDMAQRTRPRFLNSRATRRRTA